MNRLHTLKTIAQTANVEYRTVQRWYSKAQNKSPELGELQGKTRYFNDEERELILSFQSSKKECQNPVEAAKIQLFDAEIIPEIQAPNLPSSVNLAQFRSQNFGSIDLSTAQQAIDLTSQITKALDADIEAQWQQLEATKKANLELQQALDNLNRQTTVYQVESRILARLQATESAQVKEALGKVQNLGA